MAAEELYLDLPPTRDAARLARWAVRTRFGRLPREALVDVQIAVGELVAIGLQHGAGPVALTVRCVAGGVEIEVRDGGGGTAAALGARAAGDPARPILDGLGPATGTTAGGLRLRIAGAA